MKLSDFKLSRILSEFVDNKYHIHLFGYDENDEFVYMEDFIDNYFYFREEYLHLIKKLSGIRIDALDRKKSIDGKSTMRVYCSNLRTMKKISVSYRKYAYSMDITPEFKYIIDNNIKWSKKRYILFFDIEINVDKEYPDKSKPENAEVPITAISCYSTKEERFYVFSWHPEKTKNVKDEIEIVNKDNITYAFCANENILVQAFITFINESNVDVISGWYSLGFDLPYIINRSIILGIDYTRLSPSGKVTIYKKGFYWKIFIDGLDHIDLLEAIKDIGYNLSNFKLKTAAKEILNDKDLEKLEDVTWKDWLDDYTGFLKYSIRDTEILKEIDSVLNVFDLYMTLQQLSNITTLGQVFYKSMIVDNYILTENWDKYAFPTRIQHSKQKYKGATVIFPEEPGLHRDVAVTDYASLYSTIMMAFNISPETFIASQVQLEEKDINIDDLVKEFKNRNLAFVDTGYDEDLFGKRYLFLAHKSKIGMIPDIIKGLFIKRKVVKEKSIDKSLSKSIRKGLDKHQSAMKLILNSTYGAMGFSGFRLFKPEAADTITFFARKAFQIAKEEINNHYKVLYGDTDSIFILYKGKTLESVKGFLKDFNNTLFKRLMSKYTNNPSKEYHFIELEFEKDLEFLFLGETKKRYYGIERGTNKKYIRGLNLIRKDAPPVVKNQFKKIVESAVRNQLKISDLTDFRSEIETLSYEKIGITKAFTKSFDQYIKMKPQALKAALWANEKLDLHISHMDNPLMFYINSKCEDDLKPAQRQQAICILEEDLNLINDNTNIFKIDYETFFSKQIIDPLDEFSLIPLVNNLLKEYKSTKPDFYKKITSKKYKNLK